MNSSQPKKITILGGGISGLTTAYRLNEWRKKHQYPLEIVLIEASSRLGGIIQTVRENNLLVEKGPDMFFTEKPAVLDLVKALGIEDQLIPTNSKYARSMIYSHGKFHPVPAGLHLFVPALFKPFFQSDLISPLGKLRTAMEYFIPKNESSNEESIEEFITRRFGGEIYREIAQPMIGGIYSGDPSQLSMSACMPKFKSLEDKYGSLIKAYRHQNAADSSKTQGPRYSLFMSFADGMQSLVDSLENSLEGVTIKLNQSIQKIRFQDGWALESNSGIEKTDILCSSLPCHVMSQLLEGTDHQSLKNTFDEFHYESVVIYSAAYRKEDISQSVDAFGYIVPKHENRKVFGCSFLSQKFPDRAPSDVVILRAFAGGAFQREFLNQAPERIRQTIQEELNMTLGIRGKTSFEDLGFYHKAMPQYTIGHHKRVARLQESARTFPNLWLAGSYLNGVGIPDVIAQSTHVAKAICDDLDEKRESGSVFTHDKVGHNN